MASSSAQATYSSAADTRTRGIGRRHRGCVTWSGGRCTEGKAVAVPLSEEELVAVAHTPPFMLQTRQMWAGEVRQPADVPLRSSEGRYVAGDLRSGAPPGVREMPGWVRCEQVCPKRVRCRRPADAAESPEAMEAAGDDDESFEIVLEKRVCFLAPNGTRIIKRTRNGLRNYLSALETGPELEGLVAMANEEEEASQGLVALAMGGLPNEYDHSTHRQQRRWRQRRWRRRRRWRRWRRCRCSRWRQLQRQRRQWRRPD